MEIEKLSLWVLNWTNQSRSSFIHMSLLSQIDSKYSKVFPDYRLLSQRSISVYVTYVENRKVNFFALTYKFLDGKIWEQINTERRKLHFDATASSNLLSEKWGKLAVLKRFDALGLPNKNKRTLNQPTKD